MSVLILFIVSFAAAISTFYVNEHLKQGPVRSSAFLSLTIAIFFFLFPKLLSPYLTTNIPVVFIGSSFIGMVSARLVSNYFLIGAAGLVFCTVYLNTSSFFNGYGGALGTSAAISLLAVLSLPILKASGKFTNGFHLLRKIVFNRKLRK
ncbi:MULTISPECIES: hypothetical protein [Olivibacter]|uniref:Uncharacterized protein n=2 Tax=Sphingobacteriaceae TaxID=84566 RepID=F4CB80_SPHS2|nr:hypothetical protein [Olivibacter sp. 47]MDM8173507.1 hypothetical protein [Olivibacter sp. 47]